MPKAGECGASLPWPGRWGSEEPIPTELTTQICNRRRRGLDVSHHAQRLLCQKSSLARHREWVPQDGCASHPRLADALASLSPQARTLWIVGDSLSYQFFFEMVCRLQRELGSEAPDGAILGSLTTISQQRVGEALPLNWYKPSWAWRSAPREVRMGRYVLCTNLSDKSLPERFIRMPRRICFLPAGCWLWTDPKSLVTVAAALERVRNLNRTTATDVAVVNAGAWYMGHGQKGETAHLHEIRELVTLVGSHRANLPRIFWRETFATHFDNPGGVWDQEGINTTSLQNIPTRCVEWQKGWTKPAVLERVLEKLQSRKEIEVLQVWDSTRNLEGLHVVNRAQDYIAGNPVDCLHFCLFSGVEDHVMDAVARKLLASSGHRRKWTNRS